MPDPGKGNRREIVILSAAAALGAGMVAGGWVILGSSYVPDLLLQVGSSLVLVIPLLFLGRVMESRLRRTEERTRSISASLIDIRSRVDETAMRLDELGALTSQDMARQHAEDLQAADVAEEQFSRVSLRDLVQRAIDRRAIAPDGVRVRVPGTEWWLRLRTDSTRPAEPTLNCVLEDRSGITAVTLNWAEGQTAAEVTVRLAEELLVRGGYPSEAVFEVSTLFRGLLHTIRTGIQGQASDANRLGPLIELPNDQWAIATDGLYSLAWPYHIPADRLTGTHEDWASYMAEMTWVDHDKFIDAYRTALDLYRARVASA
jgi:hypothetical protein